MMDRRLNSKTLVAMLPILCLLMVVWVTPICSGTPFEARPVAFKTSDSTADESNRDALLQLTAGGHVLGFGQSEVYIAAADHALKVEFLDARPVGPVEAEKLSSASGDLKTASPLKKVTYSNLWDGVSLVYEKSKPGFVKSTYHVAPGRGPSRVDQIRLAYNVPVRLDKSGNLDIEPGRAYWVLARDGLNISYNGIPVSLTTDIDVSLDYNPGTANGWNMIGCPNDANYLWDDVEVVAYDASGNVVFGPTAISALPDPNPYIDNRLWQWENGSYASYLPVDTFLMETYCGYWVQAKQAGVSLRFPVTAQASLSNSKVMFASLLNRSKKWMDKWIKGTPEAVADSGDTPPLPMGGLTGTDAGKPGGGGGCFIETAAR